ncbi:hypothetical protein GCM10010378_42020 [Streptomyces viridochromogenes]
MVGTGPALGEGDGGGFRHVRHEKTSQTKECVVPIFIRCPGHLKDDGKFGQNTAAEKLAGDDRSRLRPYRTGIRPRGGPGEIRLSRAGRGPQNPAMPKNIASLPPTAAVRPVRSQQQPGRPWGPTPPTS